MIKEIKATERNGTWEMIDLPKRKIAIGLKWVFKTKYCADGSILSTKLVLWQKDIHINMALILKRHFLW